MNVTLHKYRRKISFQFFFGDQLEDIISIFMLSSNDQVISFERKVHLNTFKLSVPYYDSDRLT